MDKSGWTYQVETRAREGHLRQECDESCPRRIVNRYRPADQAPLYELKLVPGYEGSWMPGHFVICEKRKAFKQRSN